MSVFTKNESKNLLPLNVIPVNKIPIPQTYWFFSQSKYYIRIKDKEGL